MQEGSNDYKLEVNSPDELHLLPPHSHKLASRLTNHVGESRKTIISNPVRIRRICPEELMFQRNTVISLGDDRSHARAGDISNFVVVVVTTEAAELVLQQVGAFQLDPLPIIEHTDLGGLENHNVVLGP